MRAARALHAAKGAVRLALPGVLVVLPWLLAACTLTKDAATRDGGQKGASQGKGTGGAAPAASSPASAGAPRDIRLAARAEDLLLCQDPEAAMALFQEMAGASSRQEARARAQLGVARAHLKLGSHQKALDVLYASRRLCEMGPLRHLWDRLLGEAAFQNHDYGVARPYLERSVRLAASGDRNRLLLQLFVCAEKSLDARAAQRYLAEVQRPLAPAVEEMVRAHLESGPPVYPPEPRVIAEGPRRRAPRPEPVPGSLPVLSRDKWRARAVKHNVDHMGPINCLTVHHTGGPSFWGRSAEEAADEIRKIQKVHQTQNRWADIGYHYIIDRAGRIWQGRPLTLQGAHAHGEANRGNIGVVMLGNYYHQDITEGQVRSLRSLVARLCEKHGIPPTHIYTHSEIREGGYTDCPGPAITRVVEKIRRSL